MGPAYELMRLSLQLNQACAETRDVGHGGRIAEPAEVKGGRILGDRR